MHTVFAPAKLDLTIEDRHSYPVKSQEWFLVPPHMAVIIGPQYVKPSNVGMSFLY